MSGCPHPHPPATAREDVAAALEAAERRCHRAGERWTESRRRTYELLLRAGGAVKAYDLIAAYAAKDEAVAKPPTIYRALEFLAQQGLVHRIESLNAFLACGSDHHGQSTEFLICDCCGGVEELDLGIGREVITGAAAHREPQPN